MRITFCGFVSGCEAWVCVSGSLHKTAVSCCFLLLVISTLENILEISLKKFANSK